ncbi:hypothetical protein HV299_21385 [Klebsiella grimontii]|uniref:hypothetical protein n=1 Tax=Klebsiella grimontii TaxID=2058152 RepID=UPI0015EAAA7D|nr:hypothetical protein [Klebsiella grimontii]QLT10762.1 hypothetical protein HV299_21385 [Klebsiella grimontii]
MSSDLRFADFSGGQGIAAYHVVSETYPLLHENLPEAALTRLSGLPNLPPSNTEPGDPGSRRKRHTRLLLRRRLETRSPGKRSATGEIGR